MTIAALRNGWRIRALVHVLLSIAATVSLTLVSTTQSHAFHFPWDQGHDTTDWNDPDPPGPCEGPECDPCNSTPSPVYLPTGHFIWSKTDIYLAGAPAVDIKRTYNSNDPRSGIFGNGWVAGCEVGLFRTNNGESELFVYRAKNGKRFQYVRQANGEFLPPEGRFDTIGDLVNGDVDLTELDGSKAVFSSVGKILSETNSDGQLLVYSYDVDGMLMSIADDASRQLDLMYDSSGRVSLITDQDGREWAYNYDANGNLIEVGDPTGLMTSYEYQAYTPAGTSHVYYLLTRVLDGAGTVVVDVSYNDGKVTSYTRGQDTLSIVYNASARVTTKTDSSGQVWTYSYDDADRVTQIQNPLGATESFEYDDNGEVTTYVDENNQSWLSSRDSIGRVMSETNPAGQTTQYTYVGNNRQPSTITTPSGSLLTVQYDSSFRPTQIVDELGNTSLMTWDADGNPESVTDARGNTVNLQFNEFGRVTSIIDALNRSSTMEYDTRGNVTRVTNPAAESIQYVYDDADRLMSVIDPMGVPMMYEYDGGGRISRILDHRNNPWLFTYDQFGRLSGERLPDNRQTTYAYNDKNQMVSSVRPDGSTIANTYDADGNLTGKNIASTAVTYTYDARGNVLSAERNGLTSSFLYDVSGHLVEESTVDDTGQLISRINYTYNSEGELVSYADTVGSSVSYQRDSRGLITSMDIDGSGATFAYDEVGQMAARSLPNSVDTAYEYDEADRLAEITHGTLESIAYGFDLAGRITSKTGNSYDWQYGYDANSRLLSAINGPDSFAYSYDASSNRTENNGVYNEYSQLQIDDDYEFQYDLLGNLTAKIDRETGERWDFAWDERNQLANFQHQPSASMPVDIQGSYVYDALGRRQSKTINGIVTTYHWAGSWLIGEYRDGVALVQYHYRFGDHSPESITTGDGQRYWVHSDHLDTPQFMTDSSGVVVWQADYDPYGRAEIDSDPDGDGNFLEFNFRFPGQYLDEETGLHYNYFRYYDPGTGRYLSSDFVKIQEGMNPYAYVLGNPISRIDVLGLAWGNARAVLHFYTGGGASVTLQTTGHYSSVTSSIQPKLNQLKTDAQTSAENKARSLGCNQSGATQNNDTVGAHGGVFWIGGFSLHRSYNCTVTKTCKDAQQCPPEQIKTYSYSCMMHSWMRDRFEDPSDFDNSKGSANSDFWDDWEYGGTPFDVTGDWNDSISGGGTL